MQISVCCIGRIRYSLGLCLLYYIFTFVPFLNATKIGFNLFGRTWELMAPWTGMQVKVPAKFILGELDVTYSFPFTKDYIHKGGFKRDVPLLADVVVMEGAAHFINQEKPEEISKHILEFFEKF